MAEITAALVKELREVSGAGMMDCKKALQETGGDIEQAQDWLRKKGLATAAKKSGRAASEGLVGMITDGKSGVAVELNSETDFVARNEGFQAFVRNVTKVAMTVGGDLDKLKAAGYPDTGRTVEEELTHNIATIGENMNLRRSAGLSVSKGVVAGYIHNKLADDLGKIGVLVALESDGDAGKLEALGKQIAMHVAAARPQWLSTEEVDTAALDRERDVLSEQARASGKPEEIIAKMVEGRLRKYYEEVVLLEQVFVMDTDKKIAKVVDEAAKDIGAPVKLSGFVRFELGEGVEKAAEED
ncbi:MAG: translation elongation factor Ts [Alphaproteobacteria bacterium]|nr:translation elongation factor Ts [Alphaproteobacteria bacterium]